MLERIGVTANDVQAVSAATMVVLTAVLIYVTWRYARDARRMVDEMRRQNRPYVYLLYEEDKTATDWTTFRLKLRNAGNPVAQDIRFNIRSEALIVQLEPDSSVRNEVAWKAVAVPISAVGVVKNGVQSLGPGDVLFLGFSRWYRSAVEEQLLDYDVEYRDGAGLVYRESLKLGFWICRPPYP